MKYDYFYGQKVSDYGIENGYVDYRALANSFDHVSADKLFEVTWQRGFEWDQENGPEEAVDEVTSWYLISHTGAEILKRRTDEVVLYCVDLDAYVWGKIPWGTQWDYELTDIKLDDKEEEPNA